MTNEELYIEKKILCPKCGHVHEFSLKSSISVNNFVVDGYCASCGAVITIDRNTIFRNSHVNVGTPTQTSSLESIDSSGSSSTDEILPEVSEFFNEDSKGSRKNLDIFE